MPQSIYRGAAFLLLSEACFVLMGTQVRTISAHLSNEMIVFFRNLLGLLLVLPLLWRAGRIQWKTDHLPLHLLRGLAGVSAMYCFFYAIAHLPLANAMILKMTAPLFIPLIAWLWLGERITLAMLLMIALGFVGVALIVKPAFHGVDPVALIALAGGWFAAVAKTTVRRLTATESPTTIVFYFALTGLVVSVVPAISVWQTPSGTQFSALLLLGLFASAGQLSMTHAYQCAPASQISPFSYSAILYASFVGWWLWGELLDQWAWLGAGLIAAAGLMLLRYQPQALAKPALSR